MRGDPSLWRADATSIVGKDFLPAIAPKSPLSDRAMGVLSRDDGIVPLICPTCQNVFAGFAQSIHASDHLATLHGVVFDILVGSESRVGLAAVFPVDDRRMACRAVAREPRARLRPEASAPVRLRFRFAQATPDTLRLDGLAWWTNRGQTGHRLLVVQVPKKSRKP